jgi:hypothetical protein
MKRLSVWASLLFLLACLVAFLGCGGSGNDSNTNPALRGRVEGYAFLQSGAIVLGNAATPPAGAMALSGATLTIDGKSGSNTTDASGKFLVTDVPIGQRKLLVSGGGAPMLEVPLTVIGSATIPTGAFAVSRTQAIDAAKSAAAGLGTVADFQILAPQQPLPAGVELKPALGGDDGKDSPALTVTLTSPQWLVFVDQQPGTRFQHPAAYFLIDAATGVVTTRNVSSWPRINGVSHYADDDKNATAQDLIQPGTRKAEPQRIREAVVRATRTVTRDHVPGATDPKTYALLIGGNSRSDMAEDIVNVKEQLFGEGGLSGPAEISTWTPAESVNPDALAQIKKLYNDICNKARPEDTILVYITSHGSKAGGVYIQKGVESDESVTPDDIFYPYIELDTSRCAACHVIFIIDTCYAGAQLSDMATKSPPHAGQKLTILASSSSTETSGGITRTRRIASGKAMGAVFTNAFLNALREFSLANGGARQGNLPQIFNNAVTIMNSPTQHPQTSFQWDGTSCGPPPTLVSVAPASVTAKHTVGSTSCPQSLGNVTLKNESDKTIGYSMSLNSSYFNLSGGLSGSLTPGQSKSWGLSFNCGKVPPLEASIGITATTEGEAQSQTLSVPVTLNSGP